MQGHYFACGYLFQIGLLVEVLIMKRLKSKSASKFHLEDLEAVSSSLISSYFAALILCLTLGA